MIKMRNVFIGLMSLAAIVLCSCMGSAGSTVAGGELTGVGAMAWSEPSPYGMVLIGKGSMKIGPDEVDSLWGINVPAKEVSVDAFWMDETEITNSEYRQFVFWVRDSLIRERLADPAYGGNELFKIEEDEEGNPITPYLNWNRPIPWKKATEDELVAIESVYMNHPVEGTRMLNASQMNFHYSYFDQMQAALRKNRLNPADRVRNTDIAVDEDAVVMISKDTAYVDDEGRIINMTINRPLSSLHDFENSYIINIYPDTTCWVNDFQNAYNEPYMRLYFSHPSYNDYPVVGVSWEQANAFCAWRTMYLQRGMTGAARQIQRYRLPTEVEWEFAARGREAGRYPWSGSSTRTEKGCYNANFKPERGNYTRDGNLITSRVASYSPNSNGLYDMAGNVAEWTSTVYTEAGVLSMNDLNPELTYNAAKEDPYRMKKKVVRGGSWKDVAENVRSDMRSYEYQNESRSYIGFRCVRSCVGQTNSRRR